ncbi:MAG: thiamine phosphate synthase [Gemmatimonadales bacterium]
MSIPRVHVITNDHVLASPDFNSKLSDLSTLAGIAIQIRAASTPAARVLSIVESVLSGQASVYVNDRIDIALAAGAGGLHLPRAGLPTGAARKLVGSSFAIGRSTHSPAAARDALRDGADYVFLGSIWETETHPGQATLGEEPLQELAGLPVIAIGGVDAARAARCAALGAYGVAAISRVWRDADPCRVVTEMLVSFEQ